ncbi:hypothetical protein VCHA39O220_110087 [Vibrio chagasii]|nr:hypothetical protein VCHA39O220_110087 [Vibrio chagasii]CAH7141758.1 hypothetical protein VCHA39O224_100096 [Vibrio chagasii]
MSSGLIEGDFCIYLPSIAHLSNVKLKAYQFFALNKIDIGR